MLTRNIYAYALLFDGRHEEAIREFQANVRLAPREPNPYDSLGEGYLVAGEPEKAVIAYAQALNIDRTFGIPAVGRPGGPHPAPA